MAIGLAQSATTLDARLVTGGLLSAPLVGGGMVMGWMFGAVCRVHVADRFTLLVEFAVRSLAIAMVIEVTLLHHPDFVGFGSNLAPRPGFAAAGRRAVVSQVNCSRVISSNLPMRSTVMSAAGYSARILGSCA